MLTIQDTAAVEARIDDRITTVDLEELVAMMQLTTTTVPGSAWVRRVTEGHRRWQAAIVGL